MQENQSEIARIRRQIALECEAIKRVFAEPAFVASHAAIDARYSNLGRHQVQLEQYVGEQEAGKVVLEVYQEVVG